MISNYMKLPFSIKFIVLSCFIIITLHGIFEIEKNEKITHKQNELSLKLSIINILVLIGTINSYVLFKQENNKQGGSVQQSSLPLHFRDKASATSSVVEFSNVSFDGGLISDMKTLKNHNNYIINRPLKVVSNSSFIFFYLSAYTLFILYIYLYS